MTINIGPEIVQNLINRIEKLESEQEELQKQAGEHEELIATLRDKVWSLEA